MGTHIAFLRGINVGGANKLPMAELVALFEEAGCSDVRTYIQSGNLAFQADDGVASSLRERIADAIQERLGLRVPVVMRTADELKATAEGNPFLAEGVEEKALHVAFLADEPNGEAVARLNPDRSPGDRFAVPGRDLYLHLPNGVGRSKLTNAYIDSTLKTVSTLRNWRTVLTLLEMAKGQPSQ